METDVFVDVVKTSYFVAKFVKIYSNENNSYGVSQGLASDIQMRSPGTSTPLV